MKRRLTALWMALCIVLTVGVASPAPLLVCRLSGAPMPPVVEAEAGMDCCRVSPAISADGAGIAWEIAQRTCCDLKVTPDRSQEPAQSFDFPVLVPAWVAALSRVPTPFVTVLALPVYAVDAAHTPRGPPLLGPSSPRAPPALS